MTADRRPLIIAALLALATVCFVWGSFAERSGHHDVHATVTTGESAGNGESPEQRAAEGGGSAISSSEASEYRPLGINLESNPLVVGGAIVSLALAGMVVARPRRDGLIAVIVLALGFTLLEVVEVVHQADVGTTGLVVLAALAGTLHALAAGLAIGSLLPAPKEPVGTTG